MKKILLTSLFVFGLMFGGSPIHAMNTSARFTGKSGIGQNQFTYTQTLRPGMVNANVLALQKKLKEFGFYHKALDSDYGSGTIAAVKQFQRAKGLKVDGIAGPKTFAMILATNAASLNNGFTSLPDTGHISLPFYGNEKFACAKSYNPVCGEIEVHAMGGRAWKEEKTFSNACVAGQAHAKILYKGECKTTKPVVCTQEYDPVCGKITSPHMGESPVFKTFPNKCALKAAGEQVTFAYKGECKTTRPVDAKYPMVTTVGHTNVTNESVTLHGSARMNGFITNQTFFVFGQDFNRVSHVPDVYDTYSAINEHHEDLRKLSSGFGQGGNFGFATGSVIDDLDSGKVYYYRACVEFTNIHNNKELVCGDVKKFETLTNNGGENKNCLIVRPNSSNSPVIALQNNKQVAEFELTNICKKDIILKDVDFKMISSFGVPQINHMDIYVDGQRKDTVIDVDTGASPLGTDLRFTSEVNTRIDAGEDVDLWVQADILGVYAPWLGSHNHSTAFAISFDDADMEYQGSTVGWNQRPVWDNLIVVHYAQ